MSAIPGITSKPDFDRYALDAMILARARRPLSHEMKNAVQGLYSGIEILAKVIEPGTKSKVSATECVALLRRQLEGLQQRLMHILDDVAPVNVDATTFDLAELVQEVTRFLTSDAAVAGVRFHLTLPPQALVHARSGTVRRLVLGYFFDAIDAMRGGTVSVTIDSDDERVSLQFRDDRVPDDPPPERAAGRIDGAYLREATRRLMALDGGDCTFEESAAGTLTRFALRRG